MSSPDGKNKLQALQQDGSGSRRGSRFQVNVVDEVSPPSSKSPSPTKSEPANLSAFYNSAYTPHPEEAQVQEVPMRKDTTGVIPLATFERQESQQFRSYGNVQTMERPPNIYNYRNANSLAGGVASRPTLRELHAANLSDEMIDEEAFELGLDGNAVSLLF